MKRLHQLTIISSLLFVNTVCYALPFNITPKAGVAFPTVVYQDSTATAYYTVSNNADVLLTGNFVKYLPPNVTQVTTDATIPNLCSHSFTLSGQGSCTLELKISGAVDGNDSDPHHHLFICMSNGLLCAGTNTPINTTVPASLPVAVGGGYYENSSSQFLPLVAQTQNQGSTWSYPSINLPSDFNTITALPATYCSTNACFEALSYNSSVSGTYPLLIATMNNGGSWSSIISSSSGPQLPSDSAVPASALFKKITCSGNLCIAGGIYSAASPLSYPLLARSTDGGMNWNYVINSQTPTLPGDYFNGGTMAGVSCSGTTCTAAGVYNSTIGGGQNFALLALSTDSGATWNYVINSSTPVLPPDYIFQGQFLNTFVNGNTLLAAGVYISNAHSAFVPLLAESLNGGQSWSYVNIPTPSDLLTCASSSAIISCSGNLCAIGNYYATTALVNSILVQMTMNNGVSWFTALDSSLTLPPDADVGNGIQFSGLFCSTNTTCMVTGGYSISSGFSRPFVLITTDSGTSWRYVLTGQTAGLPADFTSGSLSAPYCKKNFCLASGAYQNTNGNFRPLTAVSFDHGLTWSFSLDDLNTPIPDNFVTGGLTSTGVSGASTLMESLLQRTRKYSTN